MTCRVTITVDPEAFAFLQKMGGTNRRGYLNALLKREHQWMVDTRCWTPIVRKRRMRCLSRRARHLGVNPR